MKHVTSSEVSVRPRPAAQNLNPSMLRFFVLLPAAGQRPVLCLVTRACCKAYGLGTRASRAEPLRMARQLHPESDCASWAQTKFKSAGDSDRAGQPCPRRPPNACRPACSTSARPTILRQALDAGPARRAAGCSRSGVEPERWIVYMGKYADNDSHGQETGRVARPEYPLSSH
jgi:hypothetical protein